MKKTYFLFTLLSLTLLTSLPADAQAFEHWHGPGFYHGGYYRPDYAGWHGGRWSHSYYGGRLAWWWVVNGAWHAYTRPVYPYPDPVATVYVVQPPPTQVIQASAPAPSTVYMPAAAPASPPTTVAQNYYYCAEPSGYYPYVQACAGGWQTVPASPVK